MKQHANTQSPEKVDFTNQSRESLELLLETIEGINRTMELKSLLAESMEATRIVMKSEASSLMLLDEDTGELYISLPTGPVKEEIKGKSIPKNRGVGGWVVENRKPYLTNNVEESKIFYKDLSNDFHTENILCVPLITRDDRIIGVLQAINRRRNKGFSPHDIPVFQALANHVTNAIERSRKMEELHSRLKEKEVMLTEIHHRIKNNLAAISALIEMELPEVKDERSKEILKTTYTRIQSMTKVHDLLCEKGLFDEVELGMYLRQLIEKIEETMNDMPSDVNIELKAENVQIAADKALLSGLVLNELLVNIYKHGYQDRTNASIIVSLTKNASQVQLSVSDNGIGLPEDFSVRGGSTIGMWIIDVMLKKLNGEIDFSSTDEGSEFVITFPY